MSSSHSPQSLSSLQAATAGQWIARIAYWNKKAVFRLLFRASAKTVATIAADPKRLGARVGMTSVLHTWGSALTHHPHIYMIVPGGGLSTNGTRWVACKPGFFLQVRVLSRLLRCLFLEGLMALHRASELTFFSDLVGLSEPQAFAAYLAPLCKKEWVVYAKPPFGGPEAVLAYLSRYTHPTARQWFDFKPREGWQSRTGASPAQMPTLSRFAGKSIGSRTEIHCPAMVCLQTTRGDKR